MNVGEDRKSHGLQISPTLPAILGTKSHRVVSPFAITKGRTTALSTWELGLGGDSRDSGNRRMALNDDVSQRWGSFAVNISLHTKSNHLSIFIESKIVIALSYLQQVFNRT